MNILSHRRNDYFVLLLLHLLNHILMFTLPTLILFFREEFSLSYTDTGILWTLLIVTTTVLSVGVGFFSDRYRDKRYVLMFAGLFLMVLGWFLMPLSSQVWQVYQNFIIIGIGASTFHPPSLAIITEMYENDKGKSLSANMAIGMGGTAVSPLIFAGIGLIVGDWRNVAYMISFGGLFFLLALLALSLKSGMFYRTNWTQTVHTNGEIKVSSNGAKLAHSYDVSFIFAPLVLVPLLFISVRSSFFRTASVFTSLLYEDYLSLTKNEATVATAFVLGFASLFTLVGGTLSDRTNPKNAILISSSGSLVFATALVYITDYSNLTSFSSFYFLLLAFYYIGSPASSALLADRVNKEQRGKMFGALFSLGQVLSLVSPLAFGFIKDNLGLSAAFFFIMMLAILAFLIGLYIYLKKEPVSSKEAPALEFQD